MNAVSVQVSYVELSGSGEIVGLSLHKDLTLHQPGSWCTEAEVT